MQTDESVKTGEMNLFENSRTSQSQENKNKIKKITEPPKRPKPHEHLIDLSEDHSDGFS